MQIKGKDFIPPTNCLWLAAMGLWGEIQLWREPESESLALLLRQTLCRLDLLLMKDAQLPGFDTLLGGSTVGERAFGGVRLAGKSRDGAMYWGGTGMDSSTGSQEGRRKRGRVTACLKTRSCVLVHWPEEKGPRKGLELQLHKVGSVGEGFSTNSKIVKNKQNKSFKGQKEFMASGQIQHIFLARRGTVLNHHF